MSPRRKSQDSSSSSSSSSSSDSDSSHKKPKKDKKKDKKNKIASEAHNYEGNAHIPGGAFAAIPQFVAGHMATPFGDHQQQSHGGGQLSSPPPYSGHQAEPVPPPSGYRLPLTTTAAFPGPHEAGKPPFYDADGVSPVFVGSALMERSVHPCKIGPHLQPFASVPYGGGEHGHHGRFDLLPFRPDQMEFVPTSHGRIPPGRRPVEGGYEENGDKLYHAVTIVNGVNVPGKAGEHLDGCRVAFGGVEYSMSNNYEVLCWR